MYRRIVIRVCGTIIQSLVYSIMAVQTRDLHPIMAVQARVLLVHVIMNMDGEMVDCCESWS